MEKRRRDRINQCLDELRDILIEAQPEREDKNKLEKANILEATVEFMRQHCTRSKIYGSLEHCTCAPVIESYSDANSFALGYRQCAATILRQLRSAQDTRNVVDNLLLAIQQPHRGEDGKNTFCAFH